MQLYAITDRHLPGGPAELIALTRAWAERAIDYIQIREKDLAPNDLRKLTADIVSAVRKQSTHTRVLLNGPAEIGLDTGADGIHLPGNARQSVALQARECFERAGKDAILSYACHSVLDVLRVREESQRDPHATAANTLILYAPVFEKVTPDGTRPGLGLESLRAAVHAAKNIPIFALGGVTKENASACINAGAAGIAGIRLFLDPGQQNLP